MAVRADATSTTEHRTGPLASPELKPETPEQLIDIIRWATSEKRPVELSGSGSKRALGRPVAAECHLVLHGLSGITAYESEELVLTAQAATPMATIQEALARKNQMLAFEPADWGPLLRSETATPGGNTDGTLGGAIACNLSGPRRVKAGAARDHLLGFHAVSGRGELFKSGGRVVKNVTGFDLSKLITGSYGTLAVMTEVSVRTLPAPEETRTVMVAGCDEERAIRAMIAAQQTPYDVSAAAHLPPDVAARSAVAPVASARQPVTALRVEGPGPSVTVRVDALREVLAPFGELETLDSAASRALWREIRDVYYFAPHDDARVWPQVWRLSVPPTEGARAVAEILFACAGEAFYDWCGGLVWLALDGEPEATGQVVRSAIAGGGHATLIRADGETRARVPVFQPQPAGLAALTRRVKDGFDPHRVLNPGRMYETI